MKPRTMASASQTTGGIPPRNVRFAFNNRVTYPPDDSCSAPLRRGRRLVLTKAAVLTLSDSTPLGAGKSLQNAARRGTAAPIYVSSCNIACSLTHIAQSPYTRDANESVQQH